VLTAVGWPRRLQVGFCVYEFSVALLRWRWTGPSPSQFHLGCAKLFDRSTHPTSKLRQLLRADKSRTMRRTTIMSGPQRLRILAIVTDIRNLRGICLVRKLYGVQSIHTDRVQLYSQKVAFYRAPSIRRRRFAVLFEKPGIKMAACGYME